jgi:hypothetical protein
MNTTTTAPSTARAAVRALLASQAPPSPGERLAWEIGIEDGFAAVAPVQPAGHSLHVLAHEVPVPSPALAHDPRELSAVLREPFSWGPRTVSAYFSAYTIAVRVHAALSLVCDPSTGLAIAQVAPWR